MSITLVFFIGLVVALVGVVPPGLINMSAVRISLKDGYNRGVYFSMGACTVVAIQTTIAVVFAKYISNHPDVVTVLQRVAFVVFVLIAVYFLLLTRKEQKPKLEDDVDIKSRHSSFFQGMLVSGLNVLPIPYQAYMALTLASFGWMTFDKSSITSYVAGAVMGTFVMLYVYIFFFDKVTSNKVISQKTMNYIIGAISGAIAVITLINILSDL